MNEQELELIERYLRHQLSAAEQQAFEARMAADEAFRQEVLLHGRAMAALNFQGLSNLKKKLQQREEPHALEKKKWQMGFFGRLRLFLEEESLVQKLAVHNFQESGDLKKKLQEREEALTLKKQKWQRRFWGLLLLLSLGLVLIFIYWCWVKIGTPPESDPAIQKTPTDQPKTKAQKSLPTDTILEKQITTAPKTPIAQRQVNNQALFSVAFQPYRDTSLNPNVRDEQNPSPFEQFLQQYWEKQYLPALQAFEKLAVELQNNDDVLFLKANALLATGQTDAAAALFACIISRKTSRFGQQADWYLALCDLKKGELVRAKKALQAIATQLDHPQREDALALLKKF